MIGDAIPTALENRPPGTAVGNYQAVITLLSYRMTDSGSHFKVEQPVQTAILRGNSGGRPGDPLTIRFLFHFRQDIMTPGSFDVFLVRARPLSIVLCNSK